MSEKKMELQDVKAIQELQTKYNQTIFDLGSVEAQIAMITNSMKAAEAEKNKFLNELNEINAAEEALVKQLESKYGSGNIDLENGVIRSV